MRINHGVRASRLRALLHGDEQEVCRSFVARMAPTCSRIVVRPSRTTCIPEMVSPSQRAAAFEDFAAARMTTKPTESIHEHQR
jgi:hypothetical protein